MSNLTKIFFKCNKTFKRFVATKRKYPINPDYVKTLPVFDYPISKSSYNRIFVCGQIKTGALGLPYKTKELTRIEQISLPRRLKLGEDHEITSIGCGIGFSLYGVQSTTNIKLYGTGINTDSQIGYHEVRADRPLEVLFFPQPIYLPFTNPEKSRIKKISAGRAHAIVLTDEGIFILGNNAFGQCSRQIICDEKYNGSKFIHHIKKIDGMQVVDVECGQDHSLALTEDGSVYSCGWGADGQTGLGHFNNEEQFTKVEGDISSEKIIKLASKADFVLALNDQGEVFGWGNTEYAQLTMPDDSQQVCQPTSIKMCRPLGKIKDIATGGSFCVVANEEGRVFVWGYGLLGLGPMAQYSKTPLEIPQTLFGTNEFQPDTRVNSVACGISHICAITNNGDLYTWGKNRNGCLGLGGDKDQPFPLRVSLGGLAQQVACGFDHTVAMCKPFI